jgi:hypothetical protein
VAALTIGTNPVATGGALRCAICRDIHAGLAPPSKHLLRANLPVSRHLGHPRTRRKRLRYDPTLLLTRPASPPPRSGQNLNAPM